MTKARCDTGRRGEDLAAEYLTRRGYQILERNFRVSCGEIDIVAQDKGVLVFIEVKTRSGLAFGSPAESVTLRKRQQIARAALAYLSRHQRLDHQARFDVVTVLLPRGGPPQIEVIPNAFDLP